MRRITKLKELEETIAKIKDQKEIDYTIINKLKNELDEEEKISRNYLQITQKGIFSKNIKKALKWNKKVIDLKQDLSALIKPY